MSGTDLPLDLIWAKSRPEYPLWRHMLDVAAVAFELAEYFGLRSPSAPWVAAIAGLHDIGKADPRFISKAPELAKRLPEEYLRIADFESGGFRHEGRSREILRRLAKALIGDLGSALEARDLDTISRAVELHHYHLNLRGSSRVPKPGKQERSLWEPVQDRLTHRFLDTFDLSVASPDFESHLDISGVRFLGAIIVADWIASNSKLFQTAYKEGSTDREYFAVARAAARDALQVIGLVRMPEDGSSCLAWSELWPEKRPRGVQKTIEGLVRDNVPPGLAIIEAPTGQGKTEAALFLAAHWERSGGFAGTYVALPTQATSNQMHSRYSEYLIQRFGSEGDIGDSPRTPVLVHGMAWLLDRTGETPGPDQLEPDADRSEDDGSRREAEKWLQNLRRALLAPHAVGTIDQVLYSALNARFGVLRLLGLGNKVLIVDEVHACDTFMLTRLERVLQWCSALGTPVILLSATLPSNQRAALQRAYLGPEVKESGAPADAYSLVTVAESRTGTLCRWRVDPTEREEKSSNSGLAVEWVACDPASDAAFAAHVLELFSKYGRDGGCMAVIVNTVIRAQAVFSMLRESLGSEIWCGLFHARFPGWRREELENDICQRFGKTGDGRPAKGVLVATQVVEQSLDLDFDMMVSELAPIDLLLQRAGRLWRHGRTRVQRERLLSIVVPSSAESGFGASERIYSRLHLLRTLGVLTGVTRSGRGATRCGRIPLPQGFRNLVEAVYSSDGALEGIPLSLLTEAAEEHARDEAKLRDRGDMGLIASPNPDEFAYPRQILVQQDEENFGENLQTRFSEYETVPIFVITREQEGDLLARAAPDVTRGDRSAIRLGDLRRLFRTRVNIPKWWLAGNQGERIAVKYQGDPVVDMRGGAWGPVHYSDELGLAHKAH